VPLRQSWLEMPQPCLLLKFAMCTSILHPRFSNILALLPMAVPISPYPPTPLSYFTARACCPQGNAAHPFNVGTSDPEKAPCRATLLKQSSNLEIGRPTSYTTSLVRLSSAWLQCRSARTWPKARTRGSRLRAEVLMSGSWFGRWRARRG